MRFEISGTGFGTEREKTPVAADDDHADFVALGGGSVLDAVVQHNIHKLRTE